MGLREGRRAHLLPEELSEKERARLEERHLEQRVVLGKAYARARRVLFWAAMLTLLDVVLVPRRWKLSFPLASQIAQLSMSVGYHGHMAAGFGVALLIAGVLFLLWWLSKNNHRWLIVAAVVAGLDVSGSFFMMNMINYEFNMVQGSIGMDVAAGVPGMGWSVYDYMLVIFVALFVHGVVVGYMIYGAIQGKRLTRVPQVSIQERMVEKTVYHEGEDYTDHPEEGCVPLRPTPPESVRLVRARYRDMDVEVSRAFGVTALSVDGQVYNDQKGTVEPLYRLRACVNGVHFLAEHLPQEGGVSVMTLYADGEELGRKTRRL